MPIHGESEHMAISSMHSPVREGCADVAGGFTRAVDAEVSTVLVRDLSKDGRKTRCTDKSDGDEEGAGAHCDSDAESRAGE